MHLDAYQIFYYNRTITYKQESKRKEKNKKNKSTQLEKKMYNKRQKQFHTKQNRQQLFNSFFNNIFLLVFFPLNSKTKLQRYSFFFFFFPFTYLVFKKSVLSSSLSSSLSTSSGSSSLSFPLPELILLAVPISGSYVSSF